MTPGARLPRRAGLPDPSVREVEATSAALAEIGLAIPPQRTLTAVVLPIEAG